MDFFEVAREVKSVALRFERGTAADEDGISTDEISPF
jgi:hypothetical protein